MILIHDTYRYIKATKVAVYKVPSAAAMDATYTGFEFYSGGVFTDPNCSTQMINHGIGIAGYGHNDTVNMDYWILKNTWGTDWGVDGKFEYVMM